MGINFILCLVSVVYLVRMCIGDKENLAKHEQKENDNLVMQVSAD